MQPPRPPPPRQGSRSTGVIERRSSSPQHRRVVYSRALMQDVIAERAAIDKAVSGKTVCTIFSDAVTKWGDRPALHWKENGDTRTLSWRGFRDEGAAGRLSRRSLGFCPRQFGVVTGPTAP